MTKTFLFLILLFSSSVFSLSSFEEYFKTGESLWMTHEYSKSQTAFQKALEYKTNDSLTLALICRNHYEIAELLPNAQKKQKLAHYQEMIKLSLEGLKINPESGELYFMHALGMGRAATTKGIFSVLATAKRIEQDWLTAIGKKISYVSPGGESSLADTYYGLAMFYRLCPDSVFLKWLIGTKGDLKKGLRFAEQAKEMEPKRIEIVMEYGIQLIATGLENKNEKQLIEGKAVLSNISKMTSLKPTDEVDKKNALKLLANPKLCREYSRDEQQVDNKAKK